MSQLEPSSNLVFLENYFIEEDGFIWPEWERICRHIKEDDSLVESDDLWNAIALKWVNGLIDGLPTGYTYTDTKNFIVVVASGGKYAELLSNHLERCLKRLLIILEGIASVSGFGKYVVIVFEDIDTYYSYISRFYPNDGAFGLSLGMYLNSGYGHFVFPYQQLDVAEPIAAHEMTHAVLSHLPIPLWLNEGIAVNMEVLLAGMEPHNLDGEQYNRHKSFWFSREIQEFWHGGSFSRSDEGQGFSYQLAQILVNKLSKNYDAFIEFVNKAQWQDAGEQASLEVYGIGLAELVTSFLGEGKWTPNPDLWRD